MAWINVPPKFTFPISIELTSHQAQQLAYMQTLCGYNEQVQVHGKLSSSELAMHTQNVGKECIAAWRNSNNHGVGVVLLADGTLLDGIFHLFDDGTCTVA